MFDVYVIYMYIYNMPYLYSIVCGMLCFCNGKGAADLDFRYCITVDHLPPTFLHPFSFFSSSPLNRVKNVQTVSKMYT